MSKLSTLLLIVGLWLGTCPIMAQALAPKKKVRKAPASAQEQKKVPFSPKENLFEQQPPSEALKKQLMAEEMVMQRAWLYSAFVPGLGQAYNKQYWKIGVIYGVFGGLAWGAIYNHDEYTRNKRKILEDTAGAVRSQENYVDDCRRNRDFCIIFGAIWYIINIFDAYVDASLQTFDVSDNISLQVQPSVLPTTQNNPAVGLSLTMKFGK